MIMNIAALVILQRPYMPFNTAEVLSSCERSDQADEMPQMTVLVTGAAGFIGYHAAVKLHRLGHGAILIRKPKHLIYTLLADSCCVG